MTHCSLAFLLGFGSNIADDDTDGVVVVLEEEERLQMTGMETPAWLTEMRGCRISNTAPLSRVLARAQKEVPGTSVVPCRGAHSGLEEIALPRHVSGTGWLGSRETRDG